MTRFAALIASLIIPVAAAAHDLEAHADFRLPATGAQDVAEQPNPPPSPYAGLEGRAIKSLSETDLADLRRGAGWGLALAAELNGIPGPAHLLEFRDEIGLSPEQVTAIETIFAQMQAEAQAAGERLIAAEHAIEQAFRAGDLTSERLRSMIDASASARAELRFIHLSRHLATPPLLTTDQISRYNALRGYGADPCGSVPKGHDPAMWRRHNNCQ